MLLSVGGVVYSLCGDGLLTDAIGGNDVNDARVGTLEAKTAPPAHTGGVGYGSVGAAGPAVVS